ncbi:MAG: alpha/beta hydrolase [Lentisphaeria bacterium]|nr:alpha/beta hydrolase [Lentisphaeria bacterium]
MSFCFQSYYLDKPLQSGRVFDLFIPAKITEETAIFFVHGGGWQAGSRTGFHLLMEQLNLQGFLCASTDYRLVAPVIPGTKPITILDQLQDIRESYDHFCSILNDLGRPLKVAVSGSSAGAHLASLLLCANPGECGESCRLDNSWCKPTCGILQSTPATFIPWPDIFPHIWSSMQQAAGCTYEANPERFQKLSLNSYIRIDNPPLFFQEAENEHMFPARMNQKIVDTHRKMNLSSRLKIYPDAEHGFLYAASRPVQIQALHDLIEFVRKGAF